MEIRTWQDGILATKRMYEKESRVYAMVVATTRRRIEKAHPATGGSEMLAHNWGNAEAKRVMAIGRKRASMVCRIGEAMYQDIVAKMRAVA